MHRHRRDGENKGPREAPIVRPFRRRPTGIHRYRSLIWGTGKRRGEESRERDALFPEARYNNGEYVFAFIPGPVIAPANS